MQDIEYSGKPLPQDDPENMIDYETALLVNTPPITATSPPPPAESPKEMEDLQAVVPTPVLQTTHMANPSALAPSRSTPTSSSNAPSAGAVLPKHSFSGHAEIFESEIGEPNAEEEYPVEEEEDELLSNHGDAEQLDELLNNHGDAELEDGTGISKRC
jgi:hypothetical protein